MTPDTTRHMVRSSASRPELRSGTLRRALGAAVAVLALLVLSACGEAEQDGGVASAGEATPAAGDDAEEAAPLDADAQALAFAECMRDNRVDMADPAPGQRGLVEAFQHGAEETGDVAAAEQALAACEEFLPQYDHGPDHAQERDELFLQIAECIRDQGLEVSDDLAELTGHDAVADDELRAAMEQCRAEIFGG